MYKDQGAHDSQVHWHPLLIMKHRKFTTALDLEGEIIRQRRMAVNERRLAIGHAVEMRRWFDLANTPGDEIKPGAREYNRDQGFKEKHLMERNLTRLKRIEDDTLPRLGRALAEFKTAMFEFAKDDNSVVLK
jgi:hypothetical protein